MRCNSLNSRAILKSSLAGLVAAALVAPSASLAQGDLLIAPLAFRMLIVEGPHDDAYLETLTSAVTAALEAAVD